MTFVVLYSPGARYPIKRNRIETFNFVSAVDFYNNRLKLYVARPSLLNLVPAQTLHTISAVIPTQQRKKPVALLEKLIII